MLTFLKKNRLFARLAGINLVSKVGDRLFYTAMLTLATSLPNGSVAVMVVSASETLPILISLFLGVVADRQKQKLNHLVSSSLFRTGMYIGIGLLLRYQLTLPLVVFASFLNLLSDISGNYSTALFSPFTKTLIKPEDMEEAQGLVSLGTQLVTVLATLLGASLLTMYTESSLAMINALIFLSVAILYSIIKPALKNQEAKIKPFEHGNTILVVRENLKSFLTDRILLVNLVQLAMLNGFFGGLTPLFALFIRENNELVTLSNPVKIALLSGMITVFMIIGNSLTTKVFKNHSIFYINLWSDLMILLVGLGFVFSNLWMIFAANSCLAFLLGIVSPRFSADVVNRYPVERIGGIITSINALLVIVPPVTSLIFPMLITVSSSLAYLGFIAYALLLIVMSLVLVKKHS
ncbi:MFS transporter [Streptococcus ferus]|uniref:Putative permease n=1 Tax=Streptococcus ferus TaxID=1345 RepID=A0A2X3Y318_9STRE|nr:MFS transporter [Streptococcus ferus]SQF41222.1 putative permease [Streptococcus ferus]